MKHIHLKAFGDVSNFILKESPLPVLKDNEVLMKVMATSINRADTLQRQGKYPPPKGATEILGLEAAGYVGKERFCALLPGGGYAQYVAVHKDHLIPIPNNISFGIAGGMAEAFLTAFLQIKLSNLRKGDYCLIYAGASGIGLATIQMCILKGIIPIVTCSQAKMEFVQKYTPHVISRNIPFEEQLEKIKQINKRGVNCVFDCVGQENVKLTLDALQTDGKWVLYGLLSGNKVQDFNLGLLLGKRINLISTTLRTRSDEFKGELVQQFKNEFYKDLETGKLVTVVDKILQGQWNEKGVDCFRVLHQEMEQNKNIGKLNIEFSE